MSALPAQIINVLELVKEKILSERTKEALLNNEERIENIHDHLSDFDYYPFPGYFFYGKFEEMEDLFLKPYHIKSCLQNNIRKVFSESFIKIFTYDYIYDKYVFYTDENDLEKVKAYAGILLKFYRSQRTCK